MEIKFGTLEFFQVMTLSDDKIFVNEENQEIPKGSYHSFFNLCLRLLIQD